MFIDIHTHQKNTDSKIKKHFNLIVKSEYVPCDLDNISAGIHPWYIENVEEQLENLEQMSSDENVKMIGECGLDKFRGADWKLQEEIFIKQIRIAENVRKPIIIHCVKAFNEILAIQKIIRPKVPMIIHGFNKNLETAEALVTKDFYLSFGAALLDSEKLTEILIKISLENIFFETDDADISVEEVYTKASEILGISIEKLSEQIYNNYLGLFI